MAAATPIPSRTTAPLVLASASPRRLALLRQVGIEPADPLVDVVEVAWRLVEIMVTDDPLRVAIPRNLPGDVVFQVDVFDAGNDG